MKKTFKLTAVFFIMAFFGGGLLSAQEEPAPIKVIPVKGNIYEVIGGRGANAGFFIGEKEVLLIEAKMDKKSAQEMIAEIKKLTPKPIKYVVLTHSDGDHVNGLNGFPQDINIISHFNTRRDMEQAFKEAEQRLYLPRITFSKKLKLHLGQELIELLYFYPAHTDGDIVIFFPAEKVAFLGDLIFLNREPLIHRHKSGNSFGLVKTLKEILKLDADTFVHGHGDIASRQDVEGVIASLQEKQTKIKALIEEGKTLPEIKKIFKVEDRPARPGGRPWLSLVEIIYLELTESK